MTLDSDYAVARRHPPEAHRLDVIKNMVAAQYAPALETSSTTVH
jgi:hypothetical protein